MAPTDVSAEAGDPHAQPVKRRAACDECRTKKLKCSGEHPTCSRCARERITCVYSAQKQMGRPKKRPRSDDDSLPASSKSGRHSFGAWEQSRSGTLQGTESDAFVVMGPYESAFTPGGGIQPWLQNDPDWSRDYGVPDGGHRHSHRGSENGMPGLTPDNSSSHSPPMLNLPPELQGHHHNHAPHGQTNHRDSSTAILLDPALAGPMGGGPSTVSPSGNLNCHPTNIPNCACLSTMYLTLNTLQGIDTDFTFPYALHPLREAMQTASTVLSCDECPTRFITAIQNTQLVGTLLMSIAERFSKVLEHTTTEAQRASEAGETKKFRLADLNTSTSHLHTGGLGCVAAFNLDLSPEEWRRMCKKVVRAEVHGPESGNDCCCYFTGVLKQMEERQERWHKSPVPKDFPGGEAGTLAMRMREEVNRENEGDAGGKRGGETGEEKKKEKEADHLCLKFAKFAKRLVDAFDWS